MVSTQPGVNSVDAQSCSSVITLPWLRFLAAPAKLQAPHSPAGEGLLPSWLTLGMCFTGACSAQAQGREQHPGAFPDTRMRGGRLCRGRKYPQSNSWELLPLAGWVCSSGKFNQVLQWQQIPICTTSPRHWGQRALGTQQPRCPQSSSCTDSGRKSPPGAGLDYHSCIPHGFLFLHLQKQMLHLLKSPRNQQLCSKTSSESSSASTAPAGLILLA